MSPRKKRPAAASAPRARSARGLQRQRLIDACISALHIHGPSHTTVEKVVAIARMSPGIVRFYFDSKAAMLVASLQFLATEFEEQVLVPVSKLKSNPVAALELLVALYLDPEIASPRKVSVWYAFWGEASSRQEYYDICGQKDESFAALVRELIGRLIEQSAQPQLDPDGIALGLIGALEMLWQDFAFRSERDIDRAAARRRSMAYLRSVFPGCFSASGDEREGRSGDTPAAAGRLGGWAYGDARAFSLEREALFGRCWQIIAHESQLPRAGDFLTAEMGAERVLVVRDACGALHALRNSCPEAPHELTTDRRGHAEGILRCRVHALEFDLSGRRIGASGTADLTALALQSAGGLIMAAPRGAPPPPERFAGWLEAGASGPSARTSRAGLRALADVREIAVAANWKLLVEQWLEWAVLDAVPGAASELIVWTSRPLAGAGCSARRYRTLAPSAQEEPWLQAFAAPNQLLQLRPDGLSILQAIPTAPDACRLRLLDLTSGEQAGGEAMSGEAIMPARAGAVRYLAGRLTPWARRSTLAVAQSAQRGVGNFGYPPGSHAARAAIAWFRAHIASRAPALALARPPTASRSD